MTDSRKQFLAKRLATLLGVIHSNAGPEFIRTGAKSLYERAERELNTEGYMARIRMVSPKIVIDIVPADQSESYLRGQRHPPAEQYSSYIGSYPTGANRMTGLAHDDPANAHNWVLSASDEQWLHDSARVTWNTKGGLK